MEQNDRIADLEKLCDMQKTTLDRQGKALREARATHRCKVCGCLWAFHPAGTVTPHASWQMIGDGKECCRDAPMGNQVEPLNQPAQKEPGLFICPKSEGCCNNDCAHKKPHNKISHSTGLNNCNSPSKCGGRTECVPQPSPVPIRGTGTAPDEKLFFEKWYPGVAKDIGNLTPRVDQIERDNEDLKPEYHIIINRVLGELEKELKDQREDYHAHIRQLAEENGEAMCRIGACKRGFAP